MDFAVIWQRQDPTENTPKLAPYPYLPLPQFQQIAGILVCLQYVVLHISMPKYTEIHADLAKVQEIKGRYAIPVVY